MRENKVMTNKTQINYRNRLSDEKVNLLLLSYPEQEDQDRICIATAFDYWTKVLYVKLLNGKELVVPFDFLKGQKSYSNDIVIDENARPNLTKCNIVDDGFVLELGDMSVEVMALSHVFLGK
jgi:hypothetical protein